MSLRMSHNGFDPESDIPDLKGRIIFITGGTRGIGKATLEELLRHNAEHIYFTGRDHDAADAIIQQHKGAGTGLTFIPCDLRHLDTVKTAAQAFLAVQSRLHVFISNAAVMETSNSFTKDGIETNFAINHLGNAALFLELLPCMISTADGGKVDVRYVAVTSCLYAFHPCGGINFSSLQNPIKFRVPWAQWTLYGQSKLANILFASYISKRYPQIKSIAVHPGIAKTGLAPKLNLFTFLVISPVIFLTPCGRMGLITPKQSSYNTLWAATVWDGKGDPVQSKNRPSYYLPVGRRVQGRRMCASEHLEKTLWDWTLAASGCELKE